MTGFDIKRVIITCDAAADMPLATAAAAMLASQHGAALHGIFFEDENLYRVAELEIAAHIGLSPTHATPALTAAALKERLEIQSLGMRRAIEAAAAQHRLPWSFGTLRAPSANAVPIAEGDMLVVDMGTKPFSSGWRPRSPWLSAVIETGNTVLLRRGYAGHGVVVVAPDDPEACDRLLRAAGALSQREATIVVLTGNSDIRAHIERSRLPGAPSFRFEQRSDEVSGLVARLRQIDPNLVVVSADEDVLTRRALAAGTSSDLLIVK